MKKQILIRLEEDLIDQLDNGSSERDISRNAYIESLIYQSLKSDITDISHQHDVALAPLSASLKGVGELIDDRVQQLLNNPENLDLSGLFNYEPFYHYVLGKAGEYKDSDEFRDKVNQVITDYTFYDETEYGEDPKVFLEVLVEQTIYRRFKSLVKVLVDVFNERQPNKKGYGVSKAMSELMRLGDV